jgi:hypothetical protein
MNIGIISYFGSREPISIAEVSLHKYFNNVYNFPMMQYYGEKNDCVKLCCNFIKENKIDILLWWYIGIPTKIFKEIKDKTNVKYIYFNWDEPFNWNDTDMVNKACYFDAVYVCCKETLYRYTDAGCNNVNYLLPAYDPNTSYLITDYIEEDIHRYECDISFCCTNLYEKKDIYPDQYINRKELIDTIYNNQDKFKFKIYGPEFLKKLYPKSYVGFMQYNEINKVFNYSKINLCTHIICDKDGYVNERTILIASSGGLLLVDKVKGIENVLNKNDFIILNKDNYINQIVEILENYDSYIDKRERIAKYCQDKYTYDIWAKFIFDNLNKN